MFLNCFADVTQGKPTNQRACLPSFSPLAAAVSVESQLSCSPPSVVATVAVDAVAGVAVAASEPSVAVGLLVH